jgi:DNA-binding GntR family transcriptional regulator
MSEVAVDEDATAEETTTVMLRHAIIRGILPPGKRLRQEVLAAELGVSRIPLRDAFRRLQAEGLIEIDGRRGARVASLSLDDVAELYELRRMLELRCLRLAIRNLTEEGAAALVDLSDRTDVEAGHTNPAGVSRRAFYLELYAWSGRRRMVALIMQIRHELGRYQALSAVPSSPEIHHLLRECIRTRDADAATRHMRDHIRRSRDDLLTALRAEQRRTGRARRPRRAAATPLATGWIASPAAPVADVSGAE